MDGTGILQGGKVYSPSGAPDLFFQEGDTPTFPGTLSTYVEWADIFPPDLDPSEGAKDGRGNWMKSIRDSDGRVSWTEFEFNIPSFFDRPLVGNSLVMVHRYIYDTSGQDFTLDEAINFTSATVPEPSTIAIFALGMIGLASRRFKKQS